MSPLIDSCLADKRFAITQHQSVIDLGLTHPDTWMKKGMNKSLSVNAPGIYMIFCHMNRKPYIGQSKNIRQRIYRHESELRRGVHINSHLQNAYSKYGGKAFTVYPLEIVEDDSINLDEREVYWISHYRAYEVGFNIAPVLPGDGGSEEFLEINRGEKNVNAKLTKEVVKEICNLLNQGDVPVKMIAERFGVERCTITQVKLGRTWRHITENYLQEELREAWRSQEVRIKHGKTDEIIQICQLLNQGLNPSEVAKQCGMSASSIWNIRAGRRHRDITEKYLAVELQEKWESAA